MVEQLARSGAGRTWRRRRPRSASAPGALNCGATIDHLPGARDEHLHLGGAGLGAERDVWRTAQARLPRGTWQYSSVGRALGEPGDVRGAGVVDGDAGIVTGAEEAGRGGGRRGGQQQRCDGQDGETESSHAAEDYANGERAGGGSLS